MLHLRLLKKVSFKQNLSGFRFTSGSTKNSRCVLPDGTSFKHKMLCSTVGMTCGTAIGIGLSYATYKCFFSIGIPMMYDFLDFYPAARPNPASRDALLILYNTCCITGITFVITIGLINTIFQIRSTDKCCKIVKYSCEYMAALVFLMLLTYGLYQLFGDDLKRILGFKSIGSI